MKSKLLPILLVVLILLNAVLIFMLIKKTHQNKKVHTERNFLTEQLQFTENQKAKFLTLDQVHKENMKGLSHQIKIQKDKLFDAFNDETVNIDSLANVAAKLEVRKELEVFRFFKSVREICSIEQQKKFDKIISKAIKGGMPGPPRGNENHPPRERRMPPPPPR